MNSIFYNEFVSGTGTFSATSTANQTTTCGPFTASGGTFSTFRCKFNPVIYSVGPLLANVAGGWSPRAAISPSAASASGRNARVSSAGLSGAGGLAGLLLERRRDRRVSAFDVQWHRRGRRSGFGRIGLHHLHGLASARAADDFPERNAASVRLHHGRRIPAAQNITVANSGGGTLSWSASSNSPWLTVSPTSGTGAGTLTRYQSGRLDAQTYNGSISVTASGATPQTISVKLTVTAPPPSLSLSTSKATFSFTLGGSAPASQTVTITNAGGGTLSWSAGSSALG